MVDDQVELRIDVWIINGLTGAKPMHHLPQKPGLSISPSANHNAIGATLRQSGLRIGNIANVAIHNHGQRHSVLNLAYKGPVS